MRIILAAVHGVGAQAATCIYDESNEKITFIFVIVAIICSTILIGMYSRTLYHAVKGSKYKFIMKSVGALIASNVGTLMIVIANYELFVVGKASVGICWLLGLGFLLQDSTFNLVHFMMAQKYQAIANRIPYFIKG